MYLLIEKTPSGFTLLPGVTATSLPRAKALAEEVIARRAGMENIYIAQVVGVLKTTRAIAWEDTTPAEGKQ